MQYISLKDKLVSKYYRLFVWAILIILILLESISVIQISKKIEYQFLRAEDNIKNSVQDKIKYMDMVSRNIRDNAAMLSLITDELLVAKNDVEVNTYMSKIFSDFLIDILYGVNIGVYIKNSGYLYIGSNSFFLRFNEKYVEKSLYDESFLNYPKEIMYVESNQNLSRGKQIIKDPNFSDEPFVMIARKKFHHDKELVIETFLPYKEFKLLLNRSYNKDFGSKLSVTLFNEKYEVISDNEEIKKEMLDKKFYPSNKNNESKIIDMERFHYSYIPGTGLGLIIKMNLLAMYSEVILFLGVSVFIIFVMLFVIKLVTNKIAKTISNPLYVIENKFSTFDFSRTEDVKFEEIETDIQEIAVLNSKYYQFVENLNIAFKQVIEAKNYEIQSRYLAIQSQMDSHFLYNTLNVIGVLGEEQGNFDVTDACKQLSNMYRYIGSESSFVCMSEEIDYLIMYVQLMQMRFPKMEVKIDVPLEMYNIKVPKLILQPIVENCLKYGEKNDVKIIVLGYIEDNNWRVKVEDNGELFDDEKKKEIMQKIKEIDSGNYKIQLQIQGMGLLNIYARLKMLYKNQTFFFIDKPQTKGTVILIGGNCEKN